METTLMILGFLMLILVDKVAIIPSKSLSLRSNYTLFLKAKLI